jgi:hypothetical protein
MIPSPGSRAARSTTYLADTIDALRVDGIEVNDETAAHLIQASMTTSTSTAPTPSTLTPNSAAKATARYAFPASPSPCGPSKLISFVRLLT